MNEQLINWLNTESENFQFILFGFLLVLLIVIEIIIPLRKSIQNRKRRWSANFIITLLNIILLSALPVSFLSASIFADGKSWGLLNQFSVPLIPTLLFSLLLRGFISFFTHFLMHKVPLLWRIHRVHHLDTEMDVSTTVRFHPLEFIINVIIGMPLILLFGVEVWALMLYELIDVTVNLLSHSNISLPSRLERFIHYIVVTPNLHRIHHSSYQKETDSNYSAVFPIWDIIFKTFKTKTKENQSTMQLGLEEIRDNRASSVLWLLKSPIENFNKANN